MENTTDDKMRVLQTQIGVEKNINKKQEQMKKLRVLQLTKQADDLRGKPDKKS